MFSDSLNVASVLVRNALEEDVNVSTKSSNCYKVCKTLGVQSCLGEDPLDPSSSTHLAHAQLHIHVVHTCC